MKLNVIFMNIRTFPILENMPQSNSADEKYAWVGYAIAHKRCTKM